MYTSLRLIALTLTIFLWLLTTDSEVGCIQSERHALLNFKQHLIDPSDRLASWAAADVDCCHWLALSATTAQVMSTNSISEAFFQMMPNGNSKLMRGQGLVVR